MVGEDVAKTEVITFAAKLFLSEYITKAMMLITYYIHKIDSGNASEGENTRLSNVRNLF